MHWLFVGLIVLLVYLFIRLLAIFRRRGWVESVIEPIGTWPRATAEDMRAEGFRKHRP